MKITSRSPAITFRHRVDTVIDQLALWLRLPPRGLNALLTVVAFVRVLAAISATVRFWLNDEQYAGPTQILLVAGYAISIIYACFSIALLVLRFVDRDTFMSANSKKLQIVLDVAFVSLLCLLTLNPQPDLFLLYVIPLYVAVEFLIIKRAMLVLLGIVLCLLVTLPFIDLLAQTRQQDRWLLRTYLPRVGLFGAMAVIYLAQRRLLTRKGLLLQGERERLVRSFRDTVANPDNLGAHKTFERQLSGFVSNIELFVDTLSVGQYSGGDLRFERAINLYQSHDGMSIDEVASGVRGMLEDIAKSTASEIATLRLLNDTQELLLYQHIGCTLEIAHSMQRLPLGKSSLLVKAFETGETLQSIISPDGEPLFFRHLATQHALRRMICIPFMTRDVRGVATFYRHAISAYTLGDQALLEASTQLISTKLANSKGFHEQERRANERMERLRALQELSAKIASFNRVDQLLDYVAKTINEQLGAEVAAVFLLRGDRLKRKAIAGVESSWFADEHYVPNTSIVGKAFLQDAPIRDNDVDENTFVLKTNVERYRSKLKTAQVKHIIAARMKGHDGQPIGVLRVLNRVDASGQLSPRGFTDSDADLLTTICSMIAVGIETIERIEQTETLFRLALAVNTRYDAESILQTIVEETRTAFRADQCGIMFFDEHQQDYGYVVAQHPANPAVDSFPILKLGGYEAVQEILRERRPLVIVDAQRDARTSPAHEMLRAQGIQSMMLVPLIVGGKVIGTLGVDSISERREFTDGEVRLGSIIAAIGEAAIEKAYSLESISSDATQKARNALSMTVHDTRDVLHAAMLRIERAKEDIMLGDTAAGLSALESSRKIARFAYDQLDHIMHDLREATLVELGLEGAMRDFIQIYVGVVEMKSNLLGSRFDFSAEYAMYRIGQELIRNAIRHGVNHRPNGKVWVTLTMNAQRIEMSIADDGPGFKLSRFTETRGLNYVRELCNDIHASFDVSPREERGVTACVILDLDQAEVKHDSH